MSAIYWLACVDCGIDLWSTSHKARRPLCEPCREDRERETARQRARAAARELPEWTRAPRAYREWLAFVEVGHG